MACWFLSPYKQPPAAVVLEAQAHRRLHLQAPAALQAQARAQALVPQVPTAALVQALMAALAAMEAVVKAVLEKAARWAIMASI